MHRRQFLSSSLAASALTLAGDAVAQAQAQAPKGTPQFYELRKYHLQSGPQTKMTQAYFADALIPALNRMGITPVGAFSLDFGPETPTFYLLLPSSSVETLVTADLNLAKDAAFMKAAEPYWNAPAASPSFNRIESQLMRAFPGWPTLTPPDTKAKRIFQLRTYESPTYRDHVTKVDMFHNGEFDFFAKAGCGQVFFGDNLIGARLPSLTYMLTFPDTAALEKGWAAFGADPGWKKLSSSQKYAFEPTVSNVSNLILKPLACSQV
jgi:hypothetical protein